MYAAISAGGYSQVNLLYNTESGVSIDRAEGWIFYGVIVSIILLPAFFIGKRGFCHYFCPWGAPNMLGARLKNAMRWPSLHLESRSEICKQCRTCLANCPMSLPVTAMVSAGSMTHSGCILCGACADNCPNGAIRYSWRRPARRGAPA